jgi:hypothetical protein
VPRLTRVAAVLAAAPDRPRGDTAVALTLRVPLTPDGQLDGGALARVGDYAGVELARPDGAGWSSAIQRTQAGLAVRPGPTEESPLWRLDLRTLRPGEYVTLFRPDGREEMYRIVNVEAP